MAQELFTVTAEVEVVAEVENLISLQTDVLLRVVLYSDDHVLSETFLIVAA